MGAQSHGSAHQKVDRQTAEVLFTSAVLSIWKGGASQEIVETNFVISNFYASIIQRR
jgi:hypothetical protein